MDRRIRLTREGYLCFLNGELIAIVQNINDAGQVYGDTSSVQARSPTGVPPDSRANRRAASCKVGKDDVDTSSLQGGDT